MTTHNKYKIFFKREPLTSTRWRFLFLEDMFKKINNIQLGADKYVPVYMLREPFKEEIQRIRLNELSPLGIQFAYKLESIPVKTRVRKNLFTNDYIPYEFKNGMFYNRYLLPGSSSIGLILTNIDHNRIRKDKYGNPIFWQMGPKRRKLALAQRALYFDENQNDAIYKIIKNLEINKSKIQKRDNKRSETIDEALGIKPPKFEATRTPALQELGYKKISTEKVVSRREIVKTGLFNIVGKYPRKIIGLGAMPPVSGWRDTLVMAAVGHMLCFVPRSSVFASFKDLRFKLVKNTFDLIESLKIPSNRVNTIKRNIGVALGAENPKDELRLAKRFNHDYGVNVFRIYTIGSDSRVIETSKLLRQKLGESIEIFVGQVADKKQAEQLISSDIKVDGLIFGHGGGQQCTSAINGMAITTIEDVYEIVLDKKFNKTSIILEGGVGRSIGTALILGADACFGNQKFVAGCIETGELFVQNNKGKICQPYPGSASPVTQIIESEAINLRLRRTDSAGRTHYSEGKPGLMFYEEKACSMAFWINEYLRHAARTLADLGCVNISQLRRLLKSDKREFLRILSEKTQYLSEAHGNYQV